jgi:LysM repeat protein
VGRLAESQTFTTPSGWDGTASPIPTGTPSPDATTYGSLTLQSEVVYQGPNGTSGYDADGNVVAYQYRDGTGRVDQYQLNYLKKETYLQGDTTGDSNTANVQPATDQAVYDTRGNEVALEQHTEDPYGNIADTVHVFAYNGAGEIIEREDGTGSSGTSLNLGSTPAKEVQHYTYVSGQQLAHFDDAGTLDVLDQVTAFSSNNDSPNSYVVQAGDTLESIAQTEYGNSNLWYVLAQANDLSSDTNLALGQRLQIPAVTTHANSAMTFKPYDPSSIIGSTTPNLPTIAPPPPAMHNNCSWLAQLVSFAVTAVVSWYAGPEAGMPAGNAAGQAAQAMLNGTFDWNRFIGHQLNPFSGNDSGMGKTVLSLLTVPTVSEVGFWTSKSGGSDFDIAVWNPLEAGMKGQFDRQSTLIAAGEGAATWGAGELGGAIGGAEGLSVDETKLLAGGLQGGVGYATNAGLNAAFGRPANFSLGGLVGSIAGGVAGAEVGVLAPGTGPVTGMWSSILQNAVGGTVDRELSVALGDTNVPTWSQIAMQSVGSGLGTGVIGTVGAINAYESQQAQTQQANQQLANNVVSQVTADQGMWNDTVWNGASAQEGAQLQSEGQLALDQAWTQTQANINGYMNSLEPNSPNDLSSEVLDVASSLEVVNSTGAVSGNSDVAYSGMPLNGQAGAMKDFFVAPEESLMGVVGSGNGSAEGSSDRLTIATGSSDAQDAVYSFVAQVVSNGGPSIDPATASASDWASYVHDYANLGEENPTAHLLSSVNVTADVQSSVVLGDQAGSTPDQSLIAQDMAPSTAIDFSRIPPLPNQPWTNQQGNTQSTGGSIPPIPDYLPPIAENFKTSPLQIDPLTLGAADIGSAQSVPIPSPSTPSIPTNLLDFNLGVKSTLTLPPTLSFEEMARQHQLEMQPGFKGVETGLSQRIYEHISQGNGLERFMGGVQSSVGQVITGFLPGEDQYGNTHNVLTGQPILAADAKVNHIASIGGLLVPGEEGFASLERAAAGSFAALFRKGETSLVQRAATRLLSGKEGVVTGGSSRVLGQNLLREMGVSSSLKWPGYQAQHVIPLELMDSPILQKVGINLDDASNGIFLRVPADDTISPMARHLGPHDGYTDAVEAQLNAMDINQPVQVLQEQVYNLQQKLKTLQKQGLPVRPRDGGTYDLWMRWLNKN